MFSWLTSSLTAENPDSSVYKTSGFIIHNDKNSARKTMLVSRMHCAYSEEHKTGRQ